MDPGARGSQRPLVKVERARQATPAGQAAKASIGCFGCLGPLLAVGIVGAVLASVGTSVFDDIGDTFDSGERLSAPAVVLDQEIEFEIGSDDTAVHPMLATAVGPCRRLGGGRR